MIVSDGLLPCELLGSGHKCSVRKVGLLYACSQCGLTSAPIRVLKEAPKAMELPEKLRQILFELMTSPDSEPPFSLMQVTSSHFDIVPGVGRTLKDHPGEIRLRQQCGEEASVIVRWGVLCPYRGHSEVVPAAPADELVAELPLFKRLKAGFEKHGLEFRAPHPPGHHLFVGRFTLPETGDGEVGIGVMLALRHEELMAKWIARNVAERYSAKS
jgi:hypothetical protein